MNGKSNCLCIPAKSVDRLFFSIVDCSPSMFQGAAFERPPTAIRLDRIGASGVRGAIMRTSSPRLSSGPPQENAKRYFQSLCI